MRTFAIITLGCKVNQHDSSSLAHVLESIGLRPRAAAEGGADLLVVNTCCVTSAAMRKSRLAIRRAVGKSPKATVLVCGCYSDYDAPAIRRVLSQCNIPAENMHLAGHHDDLPATIDRIGRSIAPDEGRTSLNETEGPAGVGWGKQQSADNADCQTILPHPCNIKTRRLISVKRNVIPDKKLPNFSRFEGHQRAFVKVQDGCDAFCSYCIVPFTRSQVWWRPIEEVVAQCRALVAEGHKEMVLSGVFLGAYGHSTANRRRWAGEAGGGPTLAALVRAVAGIENLWRVRLSSLEPGDLTDELLAAAREAANFAPHFHLPLQSGSDAVLARMNRQYRAEDYRRMVARLRGAMDRPAITTDIIVGFPGESEADFAATLEMARYAEFAKVHAFAFSAIEPTAAWRMREAAPPPPVVQERMGRLGRLAREMAENYRRQFVGETMEAVVEISPARRWKAMTDRHETIFFERGTEELTGRLVRLRVTGVCEGGLTGETVGRSSEAVGRRQ